MPLQVLSSAPLQRPPTRGSAFLSIATRLYRLGVIVAIVFLVREMATRVIGDQPIKVEEVRPFFEHAAKLEDDPSERMGQFVRDKDGKPLGYVLRTSPHSDKIIGYAGWTDTLIALGNDDKVIGIKIRSSQDTKEHVFEKIAEEPSFVGKWDGMSWDEVAAKEARRGWDDVAGASMSSMAIATGIQYRFRKSIQQREEIPARVLSVAGRALPMPDWFNQGFHYSYRFFAGFTWNDVGTVGVLLIALAFSFTRLRSLTWARRAFQVVLIGYLGVFNGQLLSQSLLSGWAASGVSWRLAPGLVLMLAAALIIPWGTRRQLYCSQICPHGAAQEWMGRLSRWRIKLPKGIEQGLRWLPPLLIALVLIVTIFGLPIDRADLEPFVAYQIWQATRVSIAIAIGGLVLSAVVPMAYCKFGCPTGLILSFVRSHGRADSFGRQDLAAGLMVVGVIGVSLNYEWLRMLIWG